MTMFPYFGLDPTMILLLPALLLAGYAQWKVSSAFKKFSQVATAGGRTGAAIAAEILRRRGIPDVKIEQVDGMLSDHYDPRSKAAFVARRTVTRRPRSAAALVGALQDKERRAAGSCGRRSCRSRTSVPRRGSALIGM
jgi:Zn-dependent membrane protease YugP